MNTYIYVCVISIYVQHSVHPFHQHQTVHSGLKIPVGNRARRVVDWITLGDSSLKDLQRRKREMGFIPVNDMSMVDPGLVGFIRLQHDPRRREDRQR